MDKSLQLDILYLQVIATILMSLDYFLTDARRMKIDAYLGGKAERLRRSTWADCIKTWKMLIKDRRLATMRATAIVVFAVSGTYEMYILKAFGVDSVTMGLALLTVVTSLWTLYIFSEVGTQIVFPFFMNGLVSILLYVVSRSRKGPVAAIGMGCLGLSFVLTYWDLTRAGLQ